MRNRKSRPLKKPNRPADLYEPKRKVNAQSYRNSPLVYLRNGPKKERYRKDVAK